MADAIPITHQYIPIDKCHEATLLMRYGGGSDEPFGADRRMNLRVFAVDAADEMDASTQTELASVVLMGDSPMTAAFGLDSLPGCGRAVRLMVRAEPPCHGGPAAARLQFELLLRRLPEGRSDER